jgi:hypothetical protein
MGELLTVYIAGLSPASNGRGRRQMKTINVNEYVIQIGDETPLELE